MIRVAKNSRIGSKKLRALTTEQKNVILINMAKALNKNRKLILEANKIDVHQSKTNLLDRLTLNNKRINLMIESLQELAKQKDYIGEILINKTLKNGLHLIEKRISFGVIGVIYESRPNVTSDVCGLCLKSGSAVILKGGSEAINTNKILVNILSKACKIKYAFQLLDSRASTYKMLKLQNYIDIIIPRGGKSLINYVKDNSKIPIIETGKGNCHIYVDSKTDIEKSIKIIINAKTQRPSVCNAVDKVLIHKDIANFFLPILVDELRKSNVEIRGCNKTRNIINCTTTVENDWHNEYLDLVIAIKIVDNFESAIKHINKYGTKHSEAILSNLKENIETFCSEVDAAVVYSNASTRFTDGSEFGFGTEIGISTQKLHARGPMGLKALTTTKYVITGDGQIRK